MPKVLPIIDMFRRLRGVSETGMSRSLCALVPVFTSAGALLVTASLATADPTTTPTAPITTINGTRPPGEMQPLVDVSVMIDTIQDDGDRLIVWEGTRKAGTRAAIHYHDYGGHTCVLSGTMTDFIEGHEPATYPAGTCYYMPPDTPMTAANLGTQDVRLTDTFVLPPGTSPTNILEPGWPLSATGDQN